MIPNDIKQVEITGNLSTASRTSFGLHSDSIAHLMSIMTDLYSDPALAVIREYSTNGFDAHVEAGVTAPIEVTLPTQMAPTLVIKDVGIGMTREQIEQNYGQYGYSSKRGTDDQTGMLGLGCKSALTYTTQFTLKAVSDGKQVVAIVSRDEVGVGFMQIVSHADVDKTNGVEISIPVPIHDVNNVRSTAEDFFSYWAPGTVLINGEVPKTFREIAEENGNAVIELDPDVFLVANDSGEESRVVMGNVAYPHSTHELLGDQVNADRCRVVAFVSMGDVSFTPSREALHMTAATKSTLDTLSEYVISTYRRRWQAEIDACPTIIDAVKYIDQTKSFFVPRRPSYGAVRREQKYTWRGESIPTYIYVEGYAWNSSYQENPSSKLKPSKTPLQSAAVDLVVTGSGRVTAKMKAQTIQYANRMQIGKAHWSGNGNRDASVYFVLDVSDTRFFRNVVPLDKIRDEKLPADLNKKVVRAKYREVTAGAAVVNHDSIDANVYDAIVIVPAGMGAPARSVLVSQVAIMQTAVKCRPFLASVYKGQEEAFAKKNPTAISIDAWFEKIRPLLEAEMRPEMRLDVSPSISKNGVRVDNVFDPEIKEYLEIERKINRHAKRDEVRSAVETFNRRVLMSTITTTSELVWPDVSALRAVITNVEQNYPALFVDSYYTKHLVPRNGMVDYVNALYLGRMQLEKIKDAQSFGTTDGDEWTILNPDTDNS